MPDKSMHDLETLASSLHPESIAEIDREIHFQPGGPLANTYPLYVEREADKELAEALKSGELCYVLAPRQVGKSSLRIRAMATLDKAGITCIPVDVSALGGKETTIEQWYDSLISCIATENNVSLDELGEFLGSQRHISPAHRLTAFIRQVLLRNCSNSIVIFLDEIDSIRTLSFSNDDFFTVVRSIYSQRAENRHYRKLTFCLLGTVAPGDLIKDINQTPFNIGRTFYLSDFTFTQARSFSKGLERFGERSDALLERTLWWTSGHPYMTQRILWELSHLDSVESIDGQKVDNVVEEIFLKRGLTEDINLSSMERCFDESPRSHKMKLLSYYSKLLADEQISVNKTDPTQLALRLIGVVSEVTNNGTLFLTVRNRIVRNVFGNTWLNDRRNAYLQGEPLALWLESNKEDSYLLRGPNVLDALDGARRRNYDLSTDEVEFLMNSLRSAATATTLVSVGERHQKALTSVVMQVENTANHLFKSLEEKQTKFLESTTKNSLWINVSNLILLLGAAISMFVSNRVFSTLLFIIIALAIYFIINLQRKIQAVAGVITQDTRELADSIIREIDKHVIELRNQTNRIEEIRYYIAVMGVSGVGKTALAVKFANPLVDISLITGTARSEQIEKVVSVQRPRESSQTIINIFSFLDRGGEFTNDVIDSLIVQGANALILTVDFGTYDQLAKKQCFSIERIQEQCSRFNRYFLEILFTGRITAHCRNFILFINKSDLLKDIDTPDERLEIEARRLFQPIIDNLRMLSSKHGVNFFVFVGSMKTSDGLPQLMECLISQILPMHAYDESLRYMPRTN